MLEIQLILLDSLAVEMLCGIVEHVWQVFKVTQSQGLRGHIGASTVRHTRSEPCLSFHCLALPGTR